MDDIVNHLQIIVDPKGTPKGSLPKALKVLDEIAHNSSADLNPRLKHFLQNRSYEKALIWLKNGEPEKGICGK
ncbi:MAG: hypothetical protein HN548_08175 [Opitutae bacterium]|jgi:hypothetical protein|nr:hypothetical protein [Opitutae bacterium]MBT5716111.1 hypothetical protein [Opitutae bacterium]